MRIRITKNRFTDDQWCLQIKHWWSGWMTKKNYEGYGPKAKVLEVAEALLGADRSEVKLNMTKKEMNDKE